MRGIVDISQEVAERQAWAARLKAYRLGCLGMTQAEFVGALMMGRDAAWKWESGARDVPPCLRELIEEWEGQR